MKTHLKKFTVVAVAIAISFLAACKKDQSSGFGQTPVSRLVNYNVTDRMQVNNEDGKPRTINTLPVINDETVAINNGAVNAGQVTLKNVGGDNLLLNVVNNGGGKLTLVQTYPATDGQASGTIYYALNKN
jgi:hypothetical protein